MPKLEKTIVLRSPQGLHARPAALFVQIANKFDSEVCIRKGDEAVNGKSIMGILMLGADQNSELVLTVNGTDAEIALQELEKFLGQETH